MPTLFNPADRASLERRLRNMPLGSAPAWGKFNCEQMLAHCTDAMKMALGDLPIGSRGAPAFLRFPLVRHAIIHWFPFPKGAPTAPELVARTAGTHHQEVESLIALIERAVANEQRGQWQPHPAFGTLTTKSWGALMYKHIDHHLRQFRA
ncbi:MAG: DUF1569 domain-containing protein [Vicinamibacterales bacterium]